MQRISIAGVCVQGSALTHSHRNNRIWSFFKQWAVPWRPLRGHFIKDLMVKIKILLCLRHPEAVASGPPSVAPRFAGLDNLEF